MKWVRPAIVSVLIGAMTAGFFMKMVSTEVYVPFVTLATTWLFKSRDDDKKQNPPNV